MTQPQFRHDNYANNAVQGVSYSSCMISHCLSHANVVVKRLVAQIRRQHQGGVLQHRAAGDGRGGHGDGEAHHQPNHQRHHRVGHRVARSRWGLQDRGSEMKNLTEFRLFLVANRNGFEDERIEALLHKIEIQMKHQSTNFGLSLASVSPPAVSP